MRAHARNQHAKNPLGLCCWQTLTFFICLNLCPS